MIRTREQNVNITGLYMPACMCMCRCALFSALSPCTAALG